MTLLIRENTSLLFLHVPKCGGSSIVEIFSSNGYSAQLQMRGLPAQECLLASPQHQTCTSLRAFLRLGKLTDIFILVRNPYKRIKSEFNWSFRDVPPSDRPDFNEWVLDSLAFALEDRSYADNHFRPSIDFLDNDVPSKVFRLEDGIELATEYFLHELGAVQQVKVSHEKNSALFSQKSLDLSFKKDALDAVNKFYKYDFAAFGYNMVDDAGIPLPCGSFDDGESPEILEKVKAVARWRINTLAASKNKLDKQIESLSGELKRKGDSLCSLISRENPQAATRCSFLEMVYDDLLVNLSHTKKILEHSFLPTSNIADPKMISDMLSLASQYRSRLILHGSQLS
jgi:hypothetical protein